MRSFRERVGTVQPRSVIQVEELDAETRVRLWNVLHTLFEQSDRVGGWSEPANRANDWIWTEVLKEPADTAPSRTSVRRLVKQQILDGSWDVALETVDEVLRVIDAEPDLSSSGLAQAGRELLDQEFERCLVGYRFIDSQIAPIDNQLDVDAITQALGDAADFSGARHHLERAIDLLSNRKSPDFANAVKESISAVESVVSKVTGKDTLGKGLKTLKDKGIVIHPSLETAWSKTYGWSSDADGIRHALIEPTRVDPELAKYMLVACSAFVSYLIGTSRKAGLLDG